MIKYPDSFKARCKILWPNHSELHNHIDRGNVKASYIIKKLMESNQKGGY